MLLLFSVPKPDSLLDDVIAGRVDHVLSAVAQMQNDVMSSRGHKGKEKQGAPGQPSAPTAKRRKACAVGGDTDFGVSDHVCMGSVCTYVFGWVWVRGCVCASTCFSHLLPVCTYYTSMYVMHGSKKWAADSQYSSRLFFQAVKSHVCRLKLDILLDRLAQGGEHFPVVTETSEMKLHGNCNPLLECATGNRNILHLCCEAENSTVAMQQGDRGSVNEGRGRC